MLDVPTPNQQTPSKQNLSTMTSPATVDLYLEHQQSGSDPVLCSGQTAHDGAGPPGWPTIIQGGMGVGVSGWRLARAVSLTGQLGVVSGVGLDTLMVRRLQLGDAGGAIRRALARFPVPSIAEQILESYFVAGGIGPGQAFRLLPKLTLRSKMQRTNLIVAANFVEVFLAKEGHDGAVGVNYMEKLQLATPASVYGAMLASVDYVLVGAGIPTQFPALLDALAAGEQAEVSVDVVGGGSQIYQVAGRPYPTAPDLGLRRPRFLAIVASDVLASYLSRDGLTRPDGFVVEGPIAGGHSAPPRGALKLDDDGQPIYGARDAADLNRLAALGLPYWLAGGYSSPRAVAEARAAGAAGVQVGSAFALCDESNLTPSIKRDLVRRALAGALAVRADPCASPTSFPFKVAGLPGSATSEDVRAVRRRVCDTGYLRALYLRPDGDVGYRCPAEPVDAYLRKGGDQAETVGRCCLCNGLISSIGLGQRRAQGEVEPPVVTIGQDLSFLPGLVTPGQDGYSAADVVSYLLAEVAEGQPGEHRQGRLTVGPAYG